MRVEGKEALGLAGGGGSVGEPGGVGRAGDLAASVWEHTIRDERDFAAHVDYVHFTPVKHGLVDEVWAWPCSSFHRAVAMGGYRGRGAAV